MICSFLRAARSISSSASAELTGERLFHKDVLAIFQCGFGQFKVSPDRGHHRDSVNFGGGHQFGTISSNLDAGI